MTDRGHVVRLAEALMAGGHNPDQYPENYSDAVRHGVMCAQIAFVAAEALLAVQEEFMAGGLGGVKSKWPA